MLILHKTIYKPDSRKKRGRELIFVVLCGSLTLENKTKPCVTHKMIIAVRISSPHDCHTVQHREHFLRLHGIITSQSAPRGMSIGHKHLKLSVFSVAIWICRIVPRIGEPIWDRWKQKQWLFIWTHRFGTPTSSTWCICVDENARSKLVHLSAKSRAVYIRASKPLKSD